MNRDAAAVGIEGDAATMAALVCVDPCGLGGVALRGPAGPWREAWLARVAALLPAGAPLRRVPLQIQDDRLLGALDLAATLRAGRPVEQQGLLAESDGGIVVLAMAERMQARTAAHIAAVLDTQEVQAGRHGARAGRCVRIGVIALDEGIDEAERAPDGLLDRLAGRIEIGALADPDPDPPPGARAWTREDIDAARALLARVTTDDGVRQALCAAALALGIDSIRAPLLALRTARAHAALNARTAVAPPDAVLATRLVLLPRATRLPPAAAEAPEEGDADQAPGQAPPESALEDTPQAPPDAADAAHTDADAADAANAANAPATSDEAILEAASAVLPDGLLDLLVAKHGERIRLRSEGRFGLRVRGGLRGRPDGVLHGNPGSGARLNLIETLRAAAPWQRLRRGADAASDRLPAVQVRREDFRVTRFRQRSETTTLFAVDASGSAALHRLGEAKGAVELLLADCYVRRDRVALIAFRGRSAEVLLPPTRSLARARRCLAGLAGGGGTPLATAIESSLLLADATRRRGGTPVAVWLTDGCANVSLAGTGGRLDAGADAMRMAQRVRAAGIRTLVLDTSPHPHDAARKLASEMGALYLPLPHADASTLSGVVRAAAVSGR